jgi:hypothetical protein
LIGPRSDGVVGGKPQQYGAITNGEGKFSITGLPAGNYGLTVERVGFLMPRGEAVTLRSGEAKADLKLKLTPTGAILGRITDSDGNPMESVGVAAETGGFNSRAVSTTTDEKGQYRLGGLAPGRYRVRAAPYSLPFPPETRTDGTEEPNYVPTYHGDSIDAKGATRVVARSGADVAGIDIRMQRRPRVRLRGVVTGIPAGTEPMMVRIALRSGMSTRSFNGVDRDGKFTVWCSEPGKFQAFAVLGSRDQSMAKPIAFSCCFM